jgi:hypothetical protein
MLGCCLYLTAQLHRLLTKFMLNEDNFLDYCHLITPQWLAGFFDGEGSVCAFFDGQRFKLQVELTQKNKYILCLVALKFSQGTIRLQKSVKGSYHKLAWHNGNCISLLEYIAPYCIFKSEIVNEALKLSKMFNQDGFSRIDDTERLERETLTNKIQKINDDNKNLKVV